MLESGASKLMLMAFIFFLVLGYMYPMDEGDINVTRNRVRRMVMESKQQPVKPVIEPLNSVSRLDLAFDLLA